MELTEILKKDLKNNKFKEELAGIYCVKPSKTAFYAERFLKVIDNFEKTFGPAENISLFSAPGRTEIGGNHTDHQHGCVLAASINLDVIAAAAPNNQNIIRIQSEGYPLDVINLDELLPDKREYNQAKALIRGVAAKFKAAGYEVKGFDAYTSSNVLKGSGLSSSAAFEVLIGNIINGLFCNGKVSAVEIAKAGQYAENIYFGKPSGLMDQMASSVGSAVAIDFKDTENPKIQKVNFDFTKTGYALCIIDSGADHSDLTDEYATIPAEMKTIAEFFNKKYLREVNKDEFIKHIPQLRKKAGDRAVLRALHYFNDSERAKEEAKALQNGDFTKFLSIINKSGKSSFMYLQNVNVCGSSADQAVAVVLAMCDEVLKDRGAFRVHGGGFAGTVQAFVPEDLLDEFKTRIEAVTGIGTCHILSIRPYGGIQFK